MAGQFNAGLIELLPIQTPIHEKKPLVRKLSMGLAKRMSRSRTADASFSSRVAVANNKLLEVAIAKCTGKLFITFATRLPQDSLRTLVPELYNTLWDMCIHQRKMDLECIVLIPEGKGLKGKLDILAEHSIDVVMSAGPEYDPKSLQLADVKDRSVQQINLSEQISDIMEGSGFVLFDNLNDKLPKAKVVALGGTFDNLHNGHRNLLSVALMVCTQKLIVGVTADSLLAGKKNAEHIEPNERRRSRVLNFLKAMTSDKQIEIEVTTLQDPYGPTIVEHSIDAIVVSSETLAGARKINEIRSDKGMNSLQIVAVIRSNIHTLSSTFIRDNKDKLNSDSRS